mmetsp:Transcript_2660/g.6046  ORF Transcript_2660/g.6046 Transcript_2660/m.6046 type:complete len:361 (+) Transcript_2660:75-1157(+)
MLLYCHGLLLLFCTSHAQHQTPDELTRDVERARDEVCEWWQQYQRLFRQHWQTANRAERRAHLFETVPLLPKARSHPRTLTGEDAEGFSDLCPELNLEDLSADPHVLLDVLDMRCHADMAVQRKAQDDDLALSRALAGRKSRQRSGLVRKLFYLRDPVTTTVTGPLQGQGEEDSAWKSRASDLVMESEIWWTVLFRQHSIYTMLSNVLKEHFEVQGLQGYLEPQSEMGPQTGDVDDLNDSYDWLEDAAIWCSAVVLLCLLAWLVFTWYRGDAALGPPRDLCCPMSLELFTDPVVAADGETYERWWIEKWILEKSPEVRPRQGTGVISPMGHGILSHTKLVSNQTVRRLANQWREKNVKMD